MTDRIPIVWPSMNGTNYTGYLVAEQSPDPGRRGRVQVELYNPDVVREVPFRFWVPADQVIRGDAAVAYHVARRMGLPVEKPDA